MDTIRRQNFPVYAAGVTHRGPYKSGPGEIGGSIAFDGMVIDPGDLIIGDADGLLCVPFGQAEALLRETSAKHAAELEVLAAMEAGRSVDRSWVDAALKSFGCTIEE